ncbi:hypothetical protein EIN_065190 [Entamoeba invadens IP1]|uniref:SPRY domain-containing protein n=1 Tax=Entamoeba invadens IP1 TaxID=370355 RepID=A0A0A1TV86_ENTIV|nr:hypothetical protein EIN_065190 [Entamoeba invadens IP1]ELP84264.1 hypothetical protein EIN_065190 [Entamoeba invadens IP1]|eukprot:XP_004183610.1 hypothetical protein EIN_065190 [Entamoeba invadens IP1]
MNFMIMNKKCREAVTTLMVNPEFYEETSFMWFVSKFEPKTLNFGNNNISVIKIYKKAMNIPTFIRFPNFNLDFYEGDLLKRENYKVVCDIFQKTTSIHLSGVKVISYNSELNVQKFVVKNSIYFSQLKRLEGEYEVVRQFLQNLVGKGCDRLHKIVLISDGENVIQLGKKSFDIFCAINYIVYNKQDCTVYAMVDPYENVEISINHFYFKKISFYTKTLPDELNSVFRDSRNHVIVENGMLQIAGPVEETKLVNEVINNAFADNVVQYGYMETEHTWKFPDCVSTYGLFATNTNEYIEDFLFKVDTNNVQHMLLIQANNIRFSNTFLALKTLEMDEVKHIWFDNECSFQNLELMYIKFSFNISIMCTFNITKLKALNLIKSSNIGITNKIYEKGVLNIFNCNKITFTQKISETLQINIDDSSDNIFFLNDKRIAVLSSTFESPYLFRLRKFISLSYMLYIENNKFYKSSPFMVTAISSNFCDEKCVLPFLYFHSNHFFILQDVRYFEAKVGYGFFSLGVIDQLNYTDFPNESLGNDEYSIGFRWDGKVHSKCLKQEFPASTDIINKFKNESGKTNTIGCGIYKDEHRNNILFFTLNGEIYGRCAIDFKTYGAVVTVSEIESLEIIDGITSKFAFDVIQILPSNLLFRTQEEID